MKIKLAQTWFAPTDNRVVDSTGRMRGGQRYAQGEHIVPDSLFDKLPSSATILEPPKDKVVKQDYVPVKKRDFDKRHENMEAREMDQIQEAHDEANKNRKEARKLILVKARLAKEAKRKAAREAEAKEPEAAEMKEG